MPKFDLVGPAGTPAVVNTVTITSVPPSGNLFIGTNNPSFNNDWTSIIPGHDIAISGTENLDIVFAAPVFSFGIQFHEPTCNNRNDGNNCPIGALGQVEPGTNLPSGSELDSTFSVTLKNGATTVGTFSFNAPDDVFAFVGVHSDMSFNKVEIRETTGTNDNEYFGEIFTGNTPFELSQEQQRAIHKATKALDDACTKIQREIDHLDSKGLTIPIEIVELELRACSPIVP